MPCFSKYFWWYSSARKNSGAGTICVTIGRLKIPDLSSAACSLARRGFLLGVVKENRRAILRAVVRTLAVELGRVVVLEENGEQLLIGNLGGIEFDFDCLGMTRPIRANFLVRGILGPAAGIADRRRGNALDLPERVLDAPETSSRKSRLSHGLKLPSFRST